MDTLILNLKVAVIGGDKRQTVISKCFINAGCEVRAFAVSDTSKIVGKAEICMNLDKAIEGVDIVVLPLPVTRDKLYVSSQGDKIALSDVVRLAAKNKAILMGGMIPEEMLRICAELGVEAFDYYENEYLQKKNALPSAEGALMIAMEHTDITVHGMKALVSGYGRIGRALADILKKLGADVAVAARRDESLCEAALMGYKTLRLDSDYTVLGRALDNTDVVFNTVPGIIFTSKVLNDCKNKPIFIEIASAPGGIDLSAARDAGIEIINAPSIPGKYAPVSAGKYIFETISNFISERKRQ